MKKLIYFIISLFLVISCKKPDLIKPELDITPQDSIVNFSAVQPAIFLIKGTGMEDLRSFSITTSPFIYKFDTSFPAFKHFYMDSIVIKLPEGAELPSDSIIIASFTLSDVYSSTTVIKYLRAQDAYPDLIHDTIILYHPTQGPSYFDMETHSLLDTTAENGTYDLVFANSSDLGYTIASPDAPWIADTYAQDSINYTLDNQRQTKLQKSLVDFNTMDDRFMYYLTVTERYIQNTPGYGIGIEGLSLGTVFVFQTQSGRKGAVKVIGAIPSNQAIILDIKYQSRPAP